MVTEQKVRDHYKGFEIGGIFIKLTRFTVNKIVEMYEFSCRVDENICAVFSGNREFQNPKKENQETSISNIAFCGCYGLGDGEVRKNPFPDINMEEIFNEFMQGFEYTIKISKGGD
jgi:hypothetical protein